MRTIGKAAVLAGVGAGVTAVRLMTRHGNRSERDDRANRWLTVTVAASPEGVGDDGALPQPLAELGDEIEVRIRPASGDKGTEIAARLREPGPSGVVARLSGDDPRQRVRLALRRAKSLIETGDVLHPDPPATHPGPGGRLIRTMTRRAGGEGRL